MIHLASKPAMLDRIEPPTECEDDVAYQQMILAHYNAAKGAVDAYHDILVKLEVPHNSP